MKRLLLLFSLFTFFSSLEADTPEDEKIKLSEEYYYYNVSQKKVGMPQKNSVTNPKLYSSVERTNGFPQNVVVEEATGAWCGYCPRGIVMCEYINEHYSDRIFSIAIHQGDRMEIDEYSAFLEKVSSYPSALINRKEQMQISTEGADLLYNQIKDELTYAQINLSAQLEDNVLHIDSETEFAVNPADEHRLAFVVVQDNVGPYTQTNYFTPSDTDLGFWATAGNQVECYFDNVARHIKTYYGIEGSLPDIIVAGEKYKYNTTIELTCVDSPECKVIAMIINYKTGEIINSGQYSINTSEGIYINQGIVNMSIGERAELKAYFNGTPIDKDLSVWKSSNEKVVTVDNSGNVVAVGEGNAIITVSYGELSAQCRVNVSLIGSVFEIDGIRYKISGENTCMVAFPEEGQQYMMEKIIIPSQIEVLGRSFVVNELEFSMAKFSGAFYKSPNLVEIELPNTITYLPGDVFEYCSQLKEFRVPSSITMIDAYAFNGCTNLSNLILNEGLTELWTCSCAWCENLKNIVLPSTLKGMGREVFYNTHPYWLYSKASVPPTLQGDLFNMEYTSEDYSECALVVPESSITAYKESEYWNRFEMIVSDDVILSRYKLKMNPGDSFKLDVVNSDDMPVTWRSRNSEVATVDVAGNVTAVSPGETTVIAECKGKTSECVIKINGKIDGLWYAITGSNTCEVITPQDNTDYDFEDLSVPSSVEIFGKEYIVTSIGKYVFDGCKNLKHVSLPNTVISIGHSSFAYTSLQRIKLPQSLLNIGDCAFDGCGDLLSIDLPEQVNVIGARAFAECRSLEELVIPSSVTSMGFYCLTGSANLKKLEMTGHSIPEVKDDILREVDKEYENCELIVPAALLDQYRNHPIFGKFANINTSSGLNVITNEEDSCDIYSIDGKLIKRKVEDKNVISTLKPGIYLLRYLNAKVRKIIIK